MQICIYPENMKRLGRKPKGAAWIDMKFNKSILADYMERFKVTTIEELMPCLYKFWDLDEERFDRLKIEIKNDSDIISKEGIKA